MAAGIVVQLVRAPPCHGGSCGFESRQSRILVNHLVFSFVCIEFFLLSSMVEALLSGILLGLIPVTILGLFFTAYLQYIRSDSNLTLN